MKKKKNMKDDCTVSCQRCGKCCQFVAIPIPQPNILDPRVIDYYKWLLAHRNISIGINEGGQWAIIVQDTCKHFSYIDKECKIYEYRYNVCKEFSPNNCMNHKTGWAGTIYKTEEEFDKEVNPFYEPKREKESIEGTVKEPNRDSNGSNGFKKTKRG